MNERNHPQHKFALKPLSFAAIPKALKKAHRYRLLNEPGAAESICLDVLEADPGNQRAIIMIVLSMSDRFGKDYAIGDKRIYSYLSRITHPYQRAYYTGITYERRAKAELLSGGPNSYELFKQAMDWFELAGGLNVSDDDGPILRWNQCARIIAANKLMPRDTENRFAA